MRYKQQQAYIQELIAKHPDWAIADIEAALKRHKVLSRVAGFLAKYYSQFFWYWAGLLTAALIVRFWS